MRSTRLAVQRPRVARRLVTAILAAALGAIGVAQTPPPPPPAGQQQQPPPPQAGGEDQRAVFRTEANFVRVDAYVTSGGQPVQDLRQEEFEVLEDGVPQQVRTFEHVVVRAANPLEAGPEPNTVSESRQMAAEAKARLFVLFLDTYHITLSSAVHVKQALVRVLQRMLGPDDLVAVMTPEMSAAGITFARRTSTIEEMLDQAWHWSRRESITNYDPIEERYMDCYPPEPTERAQVSAIAREMIARRRERLSLEALADLVAHLGGLREERKAVLAVSEGWLIYQADPGLGRLTRTQQSGGLGGAATRCDGERAALSQEDHSRDFRNLLDDANRANVSFYPVDPRGLAVFDSSIGSDDFVSPSDDAAHLSSRLESLRTLAVATDGLAIINSNDIDHGLQRVVDDLTSYYLLGYYSTNTKLDGKFRAITVRVKRPKVEVRARRGYRAATKEEVAARTVAMTGAPSSPASPVATAVSGLSKIRTDAVVQTRVGYSWQAGPAGAPQACLWIVGELDPTAATRDEEWKNGADLSIAISGPDKSALKNLTQTLTHDARTFLTRLPTDAGGLGPGDYTLRVTTKPAGASLGSTETLRVVVPRAPGGDLVAVGQPMLFRRGPFSGPGWLPAGDLRFRRQERVRVEVPVVGAIASSAVRLLDRAGNPLNVPVSTSERQEAGGTVVVGELPLAPFGAGDYVLEVSFVHGATTQKVIAAFRIVL
jgi:VWFA-related protein